MTMTITPHDDTEFETSGRRRKITKFALSGVAVLGVGDIVGRPRWPAWTCPALTTRQPTS